VNLKAAGFSRVKITMLAGGIGSTIVQGIK
jgi:hypothetical protein